jgi:hypothetical protein
MPVVVCLGLGGRDVADWFEQSGSAEIIQIDCEQAQKPG